MANMKIDTLRKIVTINNTEYPMFCGFLSAIELDKMAVVPRFSEDKDHMQIATDVLGGLVNEWQRPLNSKKIKDIKKIYSRDTKDNLMANPVLLGVAKPNIGGKVNVKVKQKTVKGAGGEVFTIDDCFELDIGYLPRKKPIWILDGQHRIYGMLDSVQKESPIPFVLLYDANNYTPPFLAEIFTQVTTKATPMQPLHGEWMKYSFNLDKYEQTPHKNAAEVVFIMCKESYFEGLANPFQNKIQLNPYQSQPGYYSFTFNMIDWQKIFINNYYGKGGDLDTKDLATQTVMAIKAFERCDKKAGQNSKVFSNDNHTILAEAFLEALLTYIRENNFTTDLKGWIDFFKEEMRSFHKCDWSMPFVTSMSMSGSYGKHSKVVASKALQLALSNPEELHGVLVTDFLKGVDASIKLIAYQVTETGNLSRQDRLEKEYILGSRTRPFQVNEGDIERSVLRVVSGSQNCQILNVYNPSVQPREKISSATTKRGLNLEDFESGKEIEVDVMSYSGDTVESTKIQIRK